MDLLTDIRANLIQVRERIERAARNANRDPNTVSLVVVSKAQSLAVINAAITAGARIFGENYAEEAVQKIVSVNAADDLSWHMIGHIQSRKAKIVAENFDMVHSLDSVKLANRLDRFAADCGRILPVLLEMNVGGEASKHGWQAHRAADWPALLDEVEQIAQLQNLSIQGLMTMPPFFDQPELARPYFKKLAALRDFFTKKIDHINWQHLSMGTSIDFEVAVNEGATFVRVGHAILGKRS